MQIAIITLPSGYLHTVAMYLVFQLAPFSPIATFGRVSISYHFITLTTADDFNRDK